MENPNRETRAPRGPEPTVGMLGIEHLAWSTRKKTVDDEVCVVTKFSFEAQPSADDLHTLHNLLRNGGPLKVTFYSPKLQMEMDLDQITKTKAGDEP